MNEEEIKQNLEENERLMMTCVCDTLANYERCIRVYLAEFVASMCDVETERMFSNDSHLDVAQARWLFWYAYRYMTNDTYEKIGKLSSELYGKTFAKVSVAESVNKMNLMIEQQPIWKKRWAIVKRIIKIQSEMVFEPQIPVTIAVPKNVEVTIKKV